MKQSVYPKRYLEWINKQDLSGLNPPSAGKEVQIGKSKPVKFPVLDPTGKSAEEAMLDWESRGLGLPESCSDTDLLWKYMVGKWNRDTTIAMWKADISSTDKSIRYSIIPEEMLIEPLCYDIEDFKSIFGRLPDLRVFKQVIMAIKNELNFNS